MRPSSSCCGSRSSCGRVCGRKWLSPTGSGWRSWRWGSPCEAKRCWRRNISGKRSQAIGRTGGPADGEPTRASSSLLSARPPCRKAVGRHHENVARPTVHQERRGLLKPGPYDRALTMASVFPARGVTSVTVSGSTIEHVGSIIVFPVPQLQYNVGEKRQATALSRDRHAETPGGVP